jgi:hypothetical protein
MQAAEQEWTRRWGPWADGLRSVFERVMDSAQHLALLRPPALVPLAGAPAVDAPLPPLGQIATAWPETPTGSRCQSPVIPPASLCRTQCGEHADASPSPVAPLASPCPTEPHGHSDDSDSDGDAGGGDGGGDDGGGDDGGDSDAPS